MKTSYIAVGFCSNDHLCLLNRIPLDSKEQMLQHEIQGGGPAGDAAVQAARLGLHAGFIGVVGDDDDGKRMLADFRAEGVNTEGLVIRPGSGSSIAYCWIEKSTGNRSVAWTRSGLKELAADEVRLDLVRHAQMLHLDGHNAIGALAAAKVAKEASVLVNFDAGTIRDGAKELLELADLMIASEEFAKRWTGLADTKAAVKKLFDDYHPLVAGATSGVRGSLAYDGREFVQVPAFTVPVVDTTGAGDVYHTGFGVRYLETQDLRECMRFGAACAALKCRALGARAGMPRRAEVDEFLKHHAS